MTTATLPTIHQRFEAPLHAVSVITRIQDAVHALAAPTHQQDMIAATTVDDLASTHVIDPRTLAIVARKDRHIQPIAAMITEHLPGVAVTVLRSAITVTLG